MLTRILFLGIMVLTGLTSCVKQHYLFPTTTGSAAQRLENVAYETPASSTNNQVPEDLSASASLNPEEFATVQNKLAVQISRTIAKPARHPLPDTLKPASVDKKAKPTQKSTSDKSEKPLPKKKNQWVTLLLFFLAGGLGAHRFYLGHYVGGAIQLGISILFILIMLAGGGFGAGILFTTIIWIWYIIDLVLILTGKLKPYKADYKVKI